MTTDQKQLRIFVVDDHKDVADGLADVLRMHGHDVTVAYSGQQAIRIFREKEFDVSFIDVMMPGMNGVESFMEIRKIRPAAKVIMMTGYSVEQLLDQAVQEGACGVLHKPISISDVLEAMDRIQSKGVVLLADDDPEFSSAIKDVLVDDGFKVCLARTGGEALKTVAGGGVDYLLLDLQLPVISGLEVYIQLRQRGIEIPTVIVTGQPKEELEAIDALRSPFVTGVLTKPFDTNSLLDHLDKLCTRSGNHGRMDPRSLPRLGGNLTPQSFAPDEGTGFHSEATQRIEDAMTPKDESQEAQASQDLFVSKSPATDGPATKAKPSTALAPGGEPEAAKSAAPPTTKVEEPAPATPAPSAAAQTPAPAAPAQPPPAKADAAPGPAKPAQPPVQTPARAPTQGPAQKPAAPPAQSASGPPERTSAPAAKGGEAPSPPPPAAPKPAGGPPPAAKVSGSTDANQNRVGRILVVDDDVDLLEGLAEVLRASGYTVETAKNDQEAKTIIKDFDAQVALLDIRLGRTNGLDLIPVLKEYRPEIYCVVITGNADKESAIVALRSGAFDYLTKPLGMDRVFTILDRCLGKFDLRQRLQAAFEELQQAKDTAEKLTARNTEFVASLSAELHTLVEDMKGNIETVFTQEHGAIGQEYVGIAKHLRESVVELRDLIERSNAWVQTTSMSSLANERRLHISALAESAVSKVKMVYGDSPPEIALRLPQERPIVWGQKRGLIQMMIGMLSMVIDVTGTRNGILLGIEPRKDGGLRITAAANGLKLDPEELPKLIEPFAAASQAAGAGAGSGGRNVMRLPLAAAYAKAHGGVLRLEGQRGKAVAASVTLPSGRVLGDESESDQKPDPSSERVA